MDDELRLLRAMTRRDQSAWAIMYDRHVDNVFGVIYHLLGADRSTAEEVCQDVWLLAIEQFDRFDPRRGEFQNWLLGIARHRALRHFRRTEGVIGGDWLDRPSEDVSPHELLEAAERADVVRAALLHLDGDHRRVLLEKYAEGRSVTEIAERTERTAKAVESLLSRARAQLRELLRGYFSSSLGGEKHEPSDVRPS
jgi:RNA polymerase sigma-70 factor, ECF subfamily